MSNQAVYEKVTTHILEQLKRGVVPWRQPWANHGVFPQNLESQKEYRGTNWLLLSSAGYASPFYATFKQITEIGGTVKKGEKAIPVIYADKILVDMATGKTVPRKAVLAKNIPDTAQQVPFLKHYSVFNVSQAYLPSESIPEIVPEDTRPPVEKAEALIKSFEASEIAVPIFHGESRNENGRVSSHYVVNRDEIAMPKRSLFTSVEAYYSTLFHEIIHSTGHSSRLNRKLSDDRKSPAYAEEELIAELGAAFLCAKCGVHNTQENSIAYINAWYRKLRKDPALIVRASSQAQKAVSLITV